MDIYERSHSLIKLKYLMNIWKNKWDFLTIVRSNVGHRAIGTV